MLLIVAHHYLVNSGLLSVVLEDPFTKRSLFALFMGAWGKTGINCFVLITGYYMCRSKVTIRKALKLFLQTEFYNIVISAILAITTGNDVFQAITHSFFFLDKESGRFVNCYLLFFLLLPFLNILVSRLKRKQHLLILGILFIIYTVRGTIPFMVVPTSYIDWFVVLFFMGSYMNLYADHLPKWTKSSGKSFLVFLLMFVLSAASIPLMLLLKPYYSWIDHYYLISDSYKILAVLLSVSAFLWVISMKPRRNRVINIIGSATYGVLLIHANSDAMRSWLWGEVVKPVEAIKDVSFYWTYILWVLGIFAVCCILDLIRQYLLEKPLFRLLDKPIRRLDEKLAKLL